jgi:hypothetical protein
MDAMEDRIQGKKNKRKTGGSSCCCEATPKLRLVDSITVQDQSGHSCSGSSFRKTTSSDCAKAAGSVKPSIAGKLKMRWIWGVSALVAVAVVAFSASTLPGSQRELLWRHVSSHGAFVGNSTLSLLPFFLLSVGISAWVTVSGFADRIKGVFTRREQLAIAGAAIVGAFMPLCSCGVIPLIAAMLASGVPLGPVMAFWISSPLMDPSMFVLTAGVLGMEYALARFISAVMLGAGAGYLIFFLTSSGRLNDQLHGLNLNRSPCCDSDRASGQGLPYSCFGREFWHQAWIIALFLGKWLLIAFLLESLIVHYVDPRWISSVLGTNQLYSIPLATIIGIPVYTSGVGAIPIVNGLISRGMSHGAALAFMVAGPVTTIPAMTAVFALVRRQTFAIYLSAGIAGALIAGFLFQAVMP